MGTGCGQYEHFSVAHITSGQPPTGDVQEVVRSPPSIPVDSVCQLHVDFGCTQAGKAGTQDFAIYGVGKSHLATKTVHLDGNEPSPLQLVQICELAHACQHSYANGLAHGDTFK
jgi:hypothetical protein